MLGADESPRAVFWSFLPRRLLEESDPLERRLATDPEPRRIRSVSDPEPIRTSSAGEPGGVALSPVREFENWHRAMRMAYLTSNPGGALREPARPPAICLFGESLWTSEKRHLLHALSE